MNPVHKRIHDQVVTPALRNAIGVRTAVIRDVDPVRKVAKIAYTDSQSEVGKEIVEVNIAQPNGIHEAGPFIGDEVIVGFINNDPTSPVILAVVDMAYTVRRRMEREYHPYQGAYVSDLYTQRTGESWRVK